MTPRMAVAITDAGSRARRTAPQDEAPEQCEWCGRECCICSKPYWIDIGDGYYTPRELRRNGIHFGDCPALSA